MIAAQSPREQPAEIEQVNIRNLHFQDQPRGSFEQGSGYQRDSKALVLKRVNSGVDVSLKTRSDDDKVRQLDMLLVSQSVMLLFEVLAIAQRVVSGHLVRRFPGFAFIEQRKGLRISPDDDHAFRLLHEQKLI